jgi:plasmid stabilization system protein ParE
LKPPILRPAAAADVEGAYRWYENQRAGLGEEFLGAVQVGLEMIAAHTLSAAVVHRDTRRLLLKRFPYGVFYRLVRDEIVVVGCLHAKRHPRVWRGRR